MTIVASHQNHMLQAGDYQAGDYHAEERTVYHIDACCVALRESTFNRERLSGS